MKAYVAPQDYPRREVERDPIIFTRSACGARQPRGLCLDERGHRYAGEAAFALGGRGIRVNVIAPGVIAADMSNFAKTDAGRDFTLGMQALKRVAAQDDIGGAVVFLASDEARWISGDTLRVDGGSKL